MFSGSSIVLKLCLVTLNITQCFKKKKGYRHILVFSNRGNSFHPIVSKCRSWDVFFFYLHITARQRQKSVYAHGKYSMHVIHRKHFKSWSYLAARNKWFTIVLFRARYLVFASDMLSRECVFGCEVKLTLSSFPKDSKVLERGIQVVFHASNTVGKGLDLFVILHSQQFYKQGTMLAQDCSIAKRAQIWTTSSEWSSFKCLLWWY